MASLLSIINSSSPWTDIVLPAQTVPLGMSSRQSIYTDKEKQEYDVLINKETHEIQILDPIKSNERSGAKGYACSYFRMVCNGGPKTRLTTESVYTQKQIPKWSNESYLNAYVTRSDCIVVEYFQNIKDAAPYLITSKWLVKGHHHAGVSISVHKQNCTMDVYIGNLVEWSIEPLSCVATTTQEGAVVLRLNWRQAKQQQYDKKRSKQREPDKIDREYDLIGEEEEEEGEGEDNNTR